MTLPKREAAKIKILAVCKDLEAYSTQPAFKISRTPPLDPAESKKRVRCDDKLSRKMFELFMLRAYPRSDLVGSCWGHFVNEWSIFEDHDRPFVGFAIHFRDWIRQKLGRYWTVASDGTLSVSEYSKEHLGHLCAAVAEWMRQAHDPDKEIRRKLFQVDLRNEGLDWKEIAATIKSDYGIGKSPEAIRKETIRFAQDNDLELAIDDRGQHRLPTGQTKL